MDGVIMANAQQSIALKRGTSNPQMDGTASPGSTYEYAASDHVHPHDTSRATAWVPLTATTDFATTGASTSTITMNTDQTANIKVGSPIRFTLNGTVYYAQVTALTSILMTIRGAPLDTTAGHLTALAYGDLNRIGQLTFMFPGYYDSTSSASLEVKLLMPSGYLWDIPIAYFVGLNIKNITADGGGTQPVINLVINGSNLLSTGLSISGTSLVRSVVQLTTANYDIQKGEYLEVAITAGTNGDARDLRVDAIYVIP